MLKFIQSLLMCAAACIFLSACATNKRSRSSEPATAPPPPAATAGAAPVEESVRRTGAGAFNQYKFTYERAGAEVEVKFVPLRLPWDDASVVAAAREVIVAAYDDRSENFPRPARWRYQGAETNAIKLEGEKFEYVFVPVREERAGVREVRAMVFWQRPKGTIK